MRRQRLKRIRRKAKAESKSKRQVLGDSSLLKSVVVSRRAVFVNVAASGSLVG